MLTLRTCVLKLGGKRARRNQSSRPSSNDALVALEFHYSLCASFGGPDNHDQVSFQKTFGACKMHVFLTLLLITGTRSKMYIHELCTVRMPASLFRDMHAILQPVRCVALYLRSFNSNRTISAPKDYEWRFLKDDRLTREKTQR